MNWLVAATHALEIPLNRAAVDMPPKVRHPLYDRCFACLRSYTCSFRFCFHKTICGGARCSQSLGLKAVRL